MRFSVQFVAATSQGFRICLKLDVILLRFFDESATMLNYKGPLGKLCHGALSER